MISLIVPVYKVESTIKRCLDSILAQTYTDFEVLLIDDGSPDSCGKICDAYAAQDSRISVFHQQNQGLAAVRNRGVQEAKGKWICFVDSDDLIHPQMLEHLYRAVSENDVGMSTCGVFESAALPESFMRLRQYECSLRHSTEENILELFQNGRHRYWIACGRLIRRDILLRNPFENGRIYEDNAIVPHWLHEAGTIAHVKENYYFYQVNPQGITQSVFTLKKLDLLWALEEQIKFYGSISYQQMKRKICAYYLTTAAWYSRRVRYELKCPHRAGEIRRDMLRLLEENPMDTLTLTEEERKSIHDALHPHIAQIRRLPKVCASVLKSGGIKALAERVRRRLSRAKE